MKSDDSSDKSNIILNEISSNNYSTIESKNSKSTENLNILDFPEEIENVDANCQQLKLSEVASSLNERPVRRSGRSAKINYKEMLNVQIFEVVRSSEQQQNDVISPKKKNNRIKRELSKRLSINNELEDDNNLVGEENEDKTVRKSEIENKEVDNVARFDWSNEDEQVKTLSEIAGEHNECGEPSSSSSPITTTATKKHQLSKGSVTATAHIKKRFSKDFSRQCVLCQKPVMGSNRFLNLCYKCMVAASKIILKMGLNDSCSEVANLLVCLDIPPCYDKNNGEDDDDDDDDDGELCDACQVQNFIRKGVEWGPDFNFMSCLSLEELRSADSVRKSRLASEKQIESWLMAFQGAEDWNKSCIFGENKPLSTPCKWDIRYFQHSSKSSRQTSCDLCRSVPTETSNRLYSILSAVTVKEEEANKHAIVCHNCLLLAHSAYNSHLDHPQCASPCADLTSCSSCLVNRLGALCPLSSIKYRYFLRTSSSSASLCEICMRNDSNLIAVIRGGNRVCHICICRIKLFHFKQSPSLPPPPPLSARCELGETCSISKCDACLVDLAGRVVDVHQIISHFHKCDYSITSSTSNSTSTSSGATNNLIARKSTKRSIEESNRDDPSGETKSKRQYTAAAAAESSLAVNVNANETPSSSAPPHPSFNDHQQQQHRPRRIIKNTQFNDFIVDKCLLRKTMNDRVVVLSATSLTANSHRKLVATEAERDVSPSIVIDHQQQQQQHCGADSVNQNQQQEEEHEQNSSDDDDDGDNDKEEQEEDSKEQEESECKSGAMDSYTENAADGKQQQQLQQQQQQQQQQVVSAANLQQEMIMRKNEEKPIGSAVGEQIDEMANNEEVSSMKPCRRIKQAMPTVVQVTNRNDQQQIVSAAGTEGTTNTETICAISTGSTGTSTTMISRNTNGPRVKQVSRQHVNHADLNLDMQRQKCVIKRGNRIIKKPESMSSYIMDYEDHRTGRRIFENDAEDDYEKDTRSEGKESSEEELQFHADKLVSFGNQTTTTTTGGGGGGGLDSSDMRCGVCSGCSRNRCCGKCDPCLLNKSQRRKTETCVKMLCSYHKGTFSFRHSQSQADARASSHKLATIQSHLDSGTDNADKSVDEIVPSESALPQMNGTKDMLYVGEVYRDSDSDDLSSEEEQLDPELDSIHTVKGDLITTALAHEGGFPVITSVKAQPNKVLCFSCGSGGDQMIHCVSCAEPFHFFCIEYQFRPKSKEMFVCRNCTKCHSCQGYGSDLKCIKCQVGFHPRCVMKYPPSKSEDRSNWACYKCAMCLHCGAKAEDMMNHVGKNDSHIDWSKDPWQCGRCARARKDGHVCPECGRAYQSGLETLECSSCTRMVHRQCSGLTEDEYEIFKCDPEANRELSTFTCSKCTPAEVEDEHKKRIRLKRQCKESDLKKYCERGVSRKMNELIHKGETHEEMLLEQHNLSDVAGHNRCSISTNQYDGVDDECEKSGGLCDPASIMISLKEYDNGIVPNGSPSVGENYDREMNQTNSSSTMFYSSESTGECDMEPLNNIMDELEPAGKAVDIDVELEEAVLAPRTKIGIFSRLNASDFISPKHLIMEALARINVKLSRYHNHSQIHKIYDKFLVYFQDLIEQIFPWVDFSNCFDTVQTVVKKYAGRVKLMLQNITENVRESRTREFDVFSSSISEIEEKLSNSFQRGREEFIIFHSEQHLTALIKSIECRSSSSSSLSLSTARNNLYTSYKLAFRTEFNTAICEKDVRICALCGISGDDGLEGRLIYGGLDVWVHVNCALWSDDVYEKEDGALVNVDLAIKQGESSVCSSCDKCGATVRCSAHDSLDGCGKSCSNIYHFACAFNSLQDPVFTETRSFYCSSSHKSCEKSVEVLTLEDMPILRRIYLPQGCLGGVSLACSDGIPSNEIVVTIGNLRINCLGKIDSCSDSHKIYLCPLEYQARRLFWSMYELDSLVMYSMSIQKEINLNKFTEGISPVITMPLSNPNPTPHRRRMIEMPEHRLIKRPKTMGVEQEIIYEMDDAGNLQPITGPIIKTKPKTFINFQCPEPTYKKVNRRFPMNCSNRNRISESKLDLDPFPMDRTPLITTSVPSTSHSYSDVQLHDHQLKTNPNDQSLSILPSQYPRKCVEPPLVIPQKGISQSVALPIKHVKPIMFQFNQGGNNTQQRSLPPSILNQLKLKQNQPKPLTFINVTQPINTLSSMNSATVTNSNNNLGSKLLKLVKIQDVRSGQVNHSPNQFRLNLQPVQQHFHPQTVRIIPSPHPNNNNNNINNNITRVTIPSVLRTALTDNSNSNNRFVHQRPQITSAESSSYHISSCGSLVTPTTFYQYDGEADDASILGDDMQTTISESICCSEPDNASTVHRTKTINKPKLHLANKYNLKFVIHGFKESKTPKACWSYMARKIGQMRKLEGLDDYELKIGDGWSKFGLDHRHVIYLIEQMVGAFQCGNYEFKFHKSRASLLRQQCLPVVPSANGCARFSPWISTKPEHFATDPLAFLLSKSNLPPKNHAPATPDQNDDSPDPDEDYLQTLASQFRNLHNGVQSREKNVRVCCSNIHGRGLFARRQFDAHEIIIEYVGEVIRSVLSDVRETEYQRTGVDCYMFRLDHDYIVDATCKGNAARFINHSCHPNCYAKVVRFEGEKHIIIIAQRQIYKGEELTYDYRFPIEDDKLPCTCGSFSCKKYLN